MVDDDTDLPPLAERRPARRNRVLLAGILVYDEGRHSFRCSIRDLSDTGARISIPKGQLIPKHVCLINVRTRTAHIAELAWAGESTAGLRLVRAIDLDKSVDIDLAYLKRILDAVSPR